MAKFYPGLMGLINGSIGSDTFAKTRYGYVIKKKPIPTNRNSPGQAETRANMKSLVSYWKVTMTKASSEAWNHAAALHKRSAWGQGFSLSGTNLFCGVNVLRMKAGLAILDAPTVFKGAPAAVNLTIGVNIGTGKLDITDWAEGNVDLAFYFYATDAVSQTISYKNRPFVFAQGGEKDSVWPLVVDVVYPAGAGSLYRVFWGLKIFNVKGAVASMVQGYSDGTIV
jgi:hypothetical protein